MRKNKMMRTAAVLGVATMLTASVLSGTFAKYTTTATGEDSARVAKWGITMGNNGKSTFSDTYGTDGKNTTVKGIDSNNKAVDVVAPGTHGEAIYKVSGAPETAYKITFSGTATNDVFLKSGLKFEYVASTNDAEKKDATYTAPKSETLTADYYPVNYSVKISSSGTDSAVPVLSAESDEQNSLKELGKEQTFETLDAAMKALNNTVVTYATPNTEAGLTVEFKWAWAFDKTDKNAISVNNIVTSNDAYDTVLGDIIANNSDLKVTSGSSDVTADANNNYSTGISYTLSMTATQID